MIQRPPLEATLANRLKGIAWRASGEAIRWASAKKRALAAIGPGSRAANKFSTFGEGSIVCYPSAALVNEHAIQIGAHTMIGPEVTELLPEFVLARNNELTAHEIAASVHGVAASAIYR